MIYAGCEAFLIWWSIRVVKVEIIAEEFYITRITAYAGNVFFLQFRLLHVLHKSPKKSSYCLNNFIYYVFFNWKKCVWKLKLLFVSIFSIYICRWNPKNKYSHKAQIKQWYFTKKKKKKRKCKLLEKQFSLSNLNLSWLRKR